MILRIVLGVIVGGALGFGLQRLKGCSTGACPLVSNPWITTLYGMLIGGLLASGKP